MIDRPIHIKTIIDVSRKIAGLKMHLSLTRSRSGKSLNVTRVVGGFRPLRIPLGTLPIENECVSYKALSRLLRGG